ncbi:hypothetical protein NC652_014407 [Populus alba x Populus x berolinensis]|nr:hypothetical protein NC652_014407 [Populus alba x Populus x berolinensis]
MEPLDKAAQQRQRRMIKNRESAARSRERKQAYQVELESLAVRLEEENEHCLKRSSLSSAIQGCQVVFHVASPVPSTTGANPEAEVIEPAIKGTLNVLKACSKAKVKRVVAVSSVLKSFKFSVAFSNFFR